MTSEARHWVFPIMIAAFVVAYLICEAVLSLRAIRRKKEEAKKKDWP